MAKDFENVTTKKHNIHYSRYIASWLDTYMKKLYNKQFDTTDLEGKIEKHYRYSRSGIFGDEFKDWLRSIELTEEEIDDIYWMANNGKMELEVSAGRFI